MTQKEKQLKAIIELAVVEGRIEELKRSKTYMSSPTYFRNRLTLLEDKVEKLQDIIEGKESVKEYKLVFELPHEVFQGREKAPVDFLQYLKREFLVQA